MASVASVTEGDYSMSKRLEPEARKAQILTTALDLAVKTHYMLVTQHTIAEELGVSKALVLHYFNSMDELRHDIVQEAIDTNNE